MWGLLCPQIAKTGQYSEFLTPRWNLPFTWNFPEFPGNLFYLGVKKSPECTIPQFVALGGLGWQKLLPPTHTKIKFCTIWAQVPFYHTQVFFWLFAQPPFYSTNREKTMTSYTSLFSASELQFKFDLLLPVMLMQRAVVHRQSKSSLAT